MKKYIIIFITSLLCLNITAQTTNITINYGNSVYFYFNALPKYQSGITYNNYTQLNLYYEHTVGSTWTLSVKAMSNEISGSGTNFLDLNHLEIQAETGGVPYTAPVPLSNANQIIASGILSSTSENIIIDITYSIGTSGLMGEIPDFYFVDLEYTLE